MKRKCMITGLVIGLQLVSGYSYVTDASWLSKTWDRLETNAAKQSYDWPKAEQYTHYAGGQLVGANLPDEDMMVLGVSLGNTFDSVKASLGQPTKETSRGLTYGGVTKVALARGCDAFGVIFGFCRFHLFRKSQ